MRLIAQPQRTTNLAGSVAWKQLTANAIRMAVPAEMEESVESCVSTWPGALRSELNIVPRSSGPAADLPTDRPTWELCPCEPSDGGKQHYHLIFGINGTRDVKLRGDRAGVRHGLMTLRQILESCRREGACLAVEIEDWRGGTAGLRQPWSFPIRVAPERHGRTRPAVPHKGGR